jgi:PqqD family protein of HPr-rel-A system
MSRLSPAPGWRSVPPDAIVWREWNGEFVVRNEVTGSTHQLSPLAGRVLRALLAADAGLSVEAIVARLNDALDPASPASHAAVENVLSEFRRLGLARQEVR